MKDLNRIAEFEKVPEEQFVKDGGKHFPEMTADGLRELYKDIIMPERATAGSAGYDLRSPFDITLAPMETAVIPTGIRARIEEGWFLMCCPRSGLGFKYRLRLDNTVGIIDSDYYSAENYGHIMIKLTNESTEGKTVEIKAGTAFAQGIFIPFGITYGDSASEIRKGGFGSTSE